MNTIFAGGQTLISASIANTDDAFEIISFKFKDAVTQDQQREAMKTLDTLVCEFKGFKSRDYFFSEDQQRWIDLVVWTNLDLAKQASDTIMNTPAAGDVFSLMEESSVIFSHYTRVGGVVAGPGS